MLRILYVDRHLLARAAASLQFWQLGYWTDLVSERERALQVVERHQYDLIIISLELPALDGLDLAREIRDLERRSGRQHHSLIFGAAEQPEALLPHCLQAGLVGCIARLYQSEELGSCIRFAEMLECRAQLWPFCR